MSGAGSSSKAAAEGGPRKKARFAAGDAMERAVEVEGLDTSEDRMEEEEAEEEEEEELPPFSVVANDVTRIRMITAAGDAAEGRTFNPLFTHQVFRVKPTEDAEVQHEELIIGYEEPKVEIVYASNSLKTWVDFKCASTVDAKELKAHGLARTNVYNSVAKHVPADYATKLSAVEAEAEAAFVPVGALVKSEPSADEGETLEVYSFAADTPEAVRFVNRMQTLVIWTIETGSCIQVPDPCWKIFTLYGKREVGGRSVYCLLGFITAHRYWVYDKFQHSVEKARLRVSQCVVLPPFQRKGHGARLLNAVYQTAHKDASILDVSVEDPSEDFQALRDVTDYQMVAKGGDIPILLQESSAAITEVCLKYKLTRLQVKRLATIAHFVKEGLTDPEADPEVGGEGLRALRLRVKQRLYRQSLCEVKGGGLIESGEGVGGGDGKKKKKEKEPEVGMEDLDSLPPEVAAAARKLKEEEEMTRVWSSGGDPEMRKKLLKDMFKGLFVQHARAAAKLTRA